MTNKKAKFRIKKRTLLKFNYLGKERYGKVKTIDEKTIVLYTDAGLLRVSRSECEIVEEI